jgi:pimeloyl-ACP methyl ester carboxylesterase
VAGAARVSSLVVDQPGTGEALRLHGMQARYDSEHWASRIVDWLEQHPRWMPGVSAWKGSRWAAITARGRWRLSRAFACGVVWGANHDWREVQQRRREREGDFPVPHYWQHVRWVWGGEDIDAFMRIAENVHLDGILDRIRVPFLVTHGEKDSQIPVKWAQRTYDQLVNSRAAS